MSRFICAQPSPQNLYIKAENPSFVLGSNRAEGASSFAGSEVRLDTKERTNGAGAKGKSNRFPKWLKAGLQIRGRLEGPDGLAYKPGNSDTYYLARTRIDLSITPKPYIGFFLQAQDSRSAGVESPLRAMSFKNTFDLRVAHVELKRAGNRFSVALKAGRQEINYGARRLLASSDWGNVNRTYDGAVISIARGHVKIDFLALSPLRIDPNHFDRNKPGEMLYAAYSTIDKSVRKSKIEPYFIVKTVSLAVGERGKTGSSRVYTMGFRFLGNLREDFEFVGEAAKQWGSEASDSVSALAGSYSITWTISKKFWNPRILGAFNHASGDSSNGDGHLETFDQLYASSHNLHGISDLVGWRNTRNYRVGLKLNPTSKLQITTELYDYFLATVQDGLYAASGILSVLNRQATGKHVGSELASYFSLKICKPLTLGAGIAHLFPGSYLRQSTSGGSYTYPYLMWTVAF